MSRKTRQPTLVQLDKMERIYQLFQQVEIEREEREAMLISEPLLKKATLLELSEREWTIQRETPFSGEARTVVLEMRELVPFIREPWTSEAGEVQMAIDRFLQEGRFLREREI